jgi:hypothetical protein
MGGGMPNGACTYLNSCPSGYECNFWKVGGVDKLCKKLCHKGGMECANGGTCQDAFKLGAFNDGDVGLCL